MYFINEAISKLSDDEQKLREEHLENAEAIPVPSINSSAAVFCAMRNLYDKFPVNQPEKPQSNKRALDEPPSGGSTPKRQKIT